MRVIIEQDEIMIEIAKLVKAKTGKTCNPDHVIFNITSEDGEIVTYDLVEAEVSIK